MIHFEIQGSLDFADRLHDALAGCQAYVNSDIILNHDRSITEGIIDLYLGNKKNDGKDILVSVSVDGFKVINQE